ncbi:MAG TPA: chemotaxis protein CheW [Gallionella sp.]
MEMQQTNSLQFVDKEALKAQVDAEIAARLELEADYARYVHRRGFNVGPLRLLVGLDEASEVAEMPPLFRLPGAPQGVKGLANRHGRVVPVLDLLALFGAADMQKDGGWLLVYGRGDEAVGIMIDSLPDRKKFALEDAVGIEKITHPIAAHARAAYREGDAIWIDMDMAALFAAVFRIDSSAA